MKKVMNCKIFDVKFMLKKDFIFKNPRITNRGALFGFHTIKTHKKREQKLSFRSNGYFNSLIGVVV